ncbi:MAG: methylated-DNA--[protein]-cysteine S-methyltransferase [Alistipes communis]|jgi:methylated-DNA--[protein]-cysteine S-methyltransferase|uniref:MGMT family protein n=1 Tax=Alistipes communis TaxID=2585118 RepID=UPI00306F3786
MEEFDAEIYDIVRQIPPGRVVTYGQLARLAQRPRWARRAGRALANAPEGLPCHRVVNSSGRLAPGWLAQRELLEHEGVTFRRNGCVDLSKHLWEEIAPIA